MRFTFRTRLVIVNLALSLVLTISVLLIFYNIYSNNIELSMINVTKNTFNRVRDNANQYFENTDNIYKMVFYNLIMPPNILNSEGFIYYENYAVLQKYFDNYFSVPLPLLGICFVDNNDKYYQSSINIISKEKALKIAKLVKDSKKQYSPIYISGEKFGLGYQNAFIVARYIKNTDRAFDVKDLGVGIFVIDGTKLINNIKQSDNIKSINTFLLDNEGNSFISKDNSNTESTLLKEIMLKEKEIEGIHKLSEGERYYFSKRTIPKINWQVVSVASIDSMLGINKQELFIILIAIGIFVFIIMSFIVTYINNRLAKPIDEIIIGVKRISNGNFKQKIQIYGRNELSEISRQINIMMEDIYNMTQKVIKTQGQLYDIELEKKHLELSGLQTQISSHFFYNMLATIRAMSNEHRDDLIGELIPKLIVYLRYVTNGENISTIKSEMNYIEEYIEMQSIKLDRGIKIIIKCVEDLYDFKIYKFLFQPIIENTIMHAFDETSKNCAICIKIKRHKNGVKVFIADNGHGMSKETLNKIKNKLDGLDNYLSNNNLNKTEHKEIGLINVQKRIMLYYGIKNQIRIRSFIEKGCFVSFYIPSFQNQHLYN